MSRGLGDVYKRQTKDIPDWSIAAGNPCKVIRKITEEDKQYYFRDRKFDDEAWEVIKDL